MNMQQIESSLQMEPQLAKRIQWIMAHSFISISGIALAIVAVIFGLVSIPAAVGIGLLAVLSLIVHGGWMGAAIMADETMATGSEQEQRMIPAIQRLIYHGVGLVVVLALAIFAGVVGMLTIGAAVAVGVIAVLSIIGHGMYFGSQMMQQEIPQEKQKNKRKRELPQRLGLSDDGELIDMSFEDEEDQQQHSRA